MCNLLQVAGVSVGDNWWSRHRSSGLQPYVLGSGLGSNT